jgi:hypothetical protein
MGDPTSSSDPSSYTDGVKDCRELLRRTLASDVIRRITGVRQESTLSGDAGTESSDERRLLSIPGFMESFESRKLRVLRLFLRPATVFTGCGYCRYCFMKQTIIWRTRKETRRAQGAKSTSRCAIDGSVDSSWSCRVMSLATSLASISWTVVVLIFCKSSSTCFDSP